MASNKVLKTGLLTLLAAIGLSSVGCAKGEKGDAGPGGRIVSSINCAGTVSGTISELNGLRVEYDVVLTEAGDVYATAGVIDSSSQYSGTAFFSAGQEGSSTGRVFVRADYVGSANGGDWAISLNRNTLAPQAIYTDPSLSSPITMNFASSACQRSDW